MPENVKHALIALLIVTGLTTLTVVLIASHRSAHHPASVEGITQSTHTSQPSLRDSIVAFAKSLSGTPYLYASSSPAGFDCSGFVYYVFKHFNMDVSRSSATIAEKGKTIDSTEAGKADIIIFTGTDSENRSPGHVGIIISEKGEPLQFIHASSGTKNSVVITNFSQSNYRKRFIKIIRVI